MNSYLIEKVSIMSFITASLREVQCQKKEKWTAVRK